MKDVISTKAAPAAIGPYSQAIRVGNLVYTSGQIPIDPATGSFAEGGIKEQTRQSLTNVKAILEEAGLTMANVIKTTVFMADMNDFADMNAVYAEFFAEPYPARSAVAVKTERLADPDVCLPSFETLTPATEAVASLFHWTSFAPVISFEKLFLSLSSSVSWRCIRVFAGPFGLEGSAGTFWLSQTRPDQSPFWSFVGSAGSFFRNVL